MYNAENVDRAEEKRFVFLAQNFPLFCAEGVFCLHNTKTAFKSRGELFAKNRLGYLLWQVEKMVTEKPVAGG